MDELIPDDDLDPQVLGEDYVLQEHLKGSIADYYRAKHPHLRQPYDPWIRPTEGETT